MSYDLFFKPRRGEWQDAAFFDYFRNRPHYTVDAHQAWYSNEETGVYFGFELQTADAGEAAIEYEAGATDYPVALNINYVRPSYFILEAEPEVTAFVRALDLLVDDPQMHGMGEGEYVAEGLLSGWNHGNAFGYSAVLREPAAAALMPHLPCATLHKVWRWNRDRAGLQAAVGEKKFVPRIMLAAIDGQPATAAVWPDGIPVVVPPVDYLIIGRQALSPKRFLFIFKRKGFVLMPWVDVLPTLLAHGTQDDAGTMTLTYERPPAAIVAFVKALPENARTIEGLPSDRVLDREIIETALAQQTEAAH